MNDTNTSQELFKKPDAVHPQAPIKINHLSQWFTARWKNINFTGAINWLGLTDGKSEYKPSGFQAHPHLCMWAQDHKLIKIRAWSLSLSLSEYLWRHLSALPSSSYLINTASAREIELWTVAFTLSSQLDNNPLFFLLSDEIFSQTPLFEGFSFFLLAFI